MVSNFNSKFLSIWDKHCTTITRRVRKRVTPWMNNDDIMKLSHQRDIAYKHFLRSKSAQATQKYKT